MLLAALALAASPALAAYDDEPSGLIPSSATLSHVRALFDRAHAREHPRTLTILEDWRLYQDGTVGSYRTFRVGRDERNVTSLGPLSYEKGILRGVRWEQNRNGITYTYPGIHEARDAATLRALRDPADDRDVRLVGESIPLNAYVVEANPPAGRRTWYYVDKRSGNLVRRETIQRHRRFTTTYDDYRGVDGVPEASRVRTVDSLGNEREQILVSRTVEEQTDQRAVEMPPSRRVVEFPGAAAVRLPLRVANGLPVVRVAVGRGTYDFLLDSGAAGIVIDPAVVEQQNLERYGRRLGATLGTFPETTAIVPTLTIGTLRMRNIVTRVVAVPFRVDDRTRVAGLLGFDFFADAVVHVDLAHGLAEAIPPERFRAPADAAGVGIALDDKTPVVRLRAGNGSARAVLDTGANRSIFQTAYAERADFAIDRGTTLARVRGVGGVATAQNARIPLLDFAGIDTREAMVDVTSADLGSDDLDGVVGTDLLRSYDLWFEYKTNAVYVRRPGAAPRPAPTPRRRTTSTR